MVNAERQGPAATRNIGICGSKGSFMLFLDADDTLERTALSFLMANYDCFQPDLVISDFKNSGDIHTDSGHERFFRESRLLDRQQILDYVRCYLNKPNRFPLFVYSWGRLFKSSIIKDNRIFFDPSLRTFEDVDFNFRYLKYAKNLFFLKETLYNHRIYENYSSASMSLSDDPAGLFGFMQALNSVESYLNLAIEGDFVKKEVAHARINYTIIQLIRVCGQITKKNAHKIIYFVRKFIDKQEIRESLRFYSPSKGDSRIIPFLIKLKVVLPLVLFCKYKANKRYRKRPINAT